MIHRGAQFTRKLRRVNRFLGKYTSAPLPRVRGTETDSDWRVRRPLATAHEDTSSLVDNPILYQLIFRVASMGAVGIDRYAFLTDSSLPVTRFSPDMHDGDDPCGV
jgi:hypothetical protein